MRHIYAHQPIHLTDTHHQRIYQPMTGVHIQNARSCGTEEVLLGGYETEGGASAISLKLYQPKVDQYDRVRLPKEFVEMPQLAGSCPKQDADKLYAGMGADAGLLAIAGGTPYDVGATDVLHGHDASKQVAIVCAETRQTDRIDDMKEGRVHPNVTVSPDGRFVLVSGGYRRDGWQGYQKWGQLELLESVEIYDRQQRCWIDVEKQFPGLSQMPRGRWGGSVSWVQDECGTERIIFAGGADTIEPTHGNMSITEPTRKIDAYDAKDCSWLEAELDTPRFNPGIGKRRGADGGAEVVIGGGTTGKAHFRGNEQAQLYSTEVLDARSLAVAPGEHLPEQRAIRIGANNCNYPIEAGPTALVLETARPSSDCNAAQGAQMGADRRFQRAYYFGFRSAASGEFGSQER